MFLGMGDINFLVQALPPPPEELANNYFNLPPTPAILPSAGALPPAPPLPPYPPPHMPILGGPPPLGLGFGMPPPPPLHYMRPRGASLHPPPGIMPPGLRPPGSYPPPPQPASSQSSTSTEETTTATKPAIHYPSQDPQRMGSSGALSKS
ncbi:hypothetical protein TNCV_426861 [Trichonephila clavipes]|nr:hypothetical protein TNCV_426861 [Trichonephila clavipes]